MILLLHAGFVAAVTDKVVCAINPFPCCYRTHNHQSSTPNCVNITFLLITVVISTGTREETEGTQESSSSHIHSQSQSLYSETCYLLSSIGNVFKPEDLMKKEADLFHLYKVFEGFENLAKRLPSFHCCCDEEIWRI